MKKDFFSKGLGVLSVVCCIAVLFGCEVSTSSVSEPSSGGLYETDPVTGLAAVPFLGDFWTHKGSAPVQQNTITVQMLKPGGWPTDPPIYDYPGTNDYGFNILPLSAGAFAYTVSGTMTLTPGQYQIETHCWPEGYPMPGTSYLSIDGRDSVSFTVVSGFDPQNYLGGIQTFHFMPTINGTCFWLSGFGTVGMTFELFVAVIMQEMIDAVPVNFPGWNVLPESIDLVTEDLPIPLVTADLSQGTGQIDVDIPGTVDVTLNAEDWMYFDLTSNPDPTFGGEYYICGYRFSFNTGALLPIDTDSADLELPFVDMALKVAEVVEGVTGDCLVRTAPSVQEMDTLFDAKESCLCTAYYLSD